MVSRKFNDFVVRPILKVHFFNALLGRHKFLADFSMPCLVSINF